MPNSSFLAELSVPDEIPDPIESLKTLEFNKLCLRLFDLGLEPTASHFMSVYVDEDWTRVYSMPQPIKIGKDNSLQPGQRIVINRHQRNGLDGIPGILIDDFVVHYEAESVLHFSSQISASRIEEGFQWRVDEQSGPFLVKMVDTVEIHEGTAYNERYNSRPILVDVNATQELHRELAVLSPACHDEIQIFKPIFHKKDN